VRKGPEKSSSKSPPKRSSSEMKEVGVLRYPREVPDGHEGYAQDEPRLEFDSTEYALQKDPVGEAILLGEILMGIDFEGDEPGDDSKCILRSCCDGSVRGGSASVCIYKGTTGVIGRTETARDTGVGSRKRQSSVGR
jgi:hypothetical protein